NVFVSGSAWTQSFKTYLAGQGYGDATYGFSIPDSDQLNELPWTNLDQVSVRFSEDTDVAESHLVVEGTSVANYPVTAFSYDAATLTATWTLGQALAPTGDRVLFHLSKL